jgi:hypothetical protein
MGKTIIFSLVIILFLINSLRAQDGFGAIQKAQKAIERGHLMQAKMHLQDAEKADYGFCGNAWMDAKSAIQRCYFQLYVAEGRFSEARKALESDDGWGGPPISDSLVLAMYIQKLGTERILSSMDSGLALAHPEGPGKSFAVIPLEKELELMLPIPWDAENDIQLFMGLSKGEFSKAYAHYFHTAGLYDMLSSPAGQPAKQRNKK